MSNRQSRIEHNISLRQPVQSGTGPFSTIEGTGGTASATASHAEGNNTTASSNYAHAEGQYTYAEGVDSHAEGDSTHANGSNSHAEGNYSRANGENSHAEGYYTYANGLNSHAQNEGTIADGKDQTAIGKYNIAQGNDFGIADTDSAFIVGNGIDDETRSNALSLTWKGDLQVAGTITDGNGVVLSHSTPNHIYTVSTAGQTTFPIAGGYNVGLINMYMNGSRLQNGNDYTATDGLNVILTSSVTAGQEIEFELLNYIGVLPEVTSVNGRTGDIIIQASDIVQLLSRWGSF